MNKPVGINKKGVVSKQEKKQKPDIVWLCLEFFQLPIDLLVNAEESKVNDDELSKDEEKDQSKASYAIIGQQQKVAFASQPSLEAGIEIGMKLASVYVLQPDLIVKQRDERSEANAMESLLQWAYHFSPTVSRYKDFCLLLEIGTCLRLFSGLVNLLQLIEEDLNNFGFIYHLGLGHTPHAAWLLSKCYFPIDDLPRGSLPEDSSPQEGLLKETFLQQLKETPLPLLDVSNKQHQQLQNLGLQTLGELLALPRAELGKRFGKEFITLLKKITGEESDLRGDHQLAKKFKAEQSFSSGVDTLEGLKIPIQQMLTEFYQYLLFHQYHANRFHWRFYYYGIPCDDVEITTSSLQGGMNAYKELSFLKLESIVLKAPVENLELICSDFSQASQSSDELFPEISHPNNQLKDYQLLLDKLIQRMGEGAVKGLLINDEHLPEYKLQSKVIDADAIKSIKAKTPSGDNAEQRDCSPQTVFHQPLWLMPKPEPIHQPATIEYDKPAFMKVVSSPQRVDSHWWQERSQRDYFIARHKNGLYYWVFKDLKSDQWFMHGVYG